MSTQRRSVSSATPILALVGLCLVPGLAWGQAGSLDPSFGGDGIVVTPMNPYGQIYGIATQADGKIVAVGYDFLQSGGGGITAWAIARYEVDGSLDTTFGVGGFVHLFGQGTYGEKAYAVAIDDSGRILVTGDYLAGDAWDFGLVRLLSDGTLDPSFGSGGVVHTDFPRKRGRNAPNDQSRAVAIQPDGKIVVAGFLLDAKNPAWYLGIARYNPDGSLDTDPVTGFGELDGGARSGLVQDPSLLSNQLGVRHGALRIDSQGRISVGMGYFADGWILARYLADGANDTAFGSDGKVFLQVPGWSNVRLWDIALQGDDIIAAGRGFESGASFFEALVTRHLASNGSLDPSFGVQGLGRTGLLSSTSANCVAVQGDDRILISSPAIAEGGTDLMVFRFDQDGSPDVSFGTAGMSELGDDDLADDPWDLALDGAGNPIIGGFSGLTGNEPSFALARWLGGGDPVPGAPSGLSATAVSGSQIDLSWIDNASDEDGFEIERSADGSNWGLLGTVGHDVVFYPDTGLGANATWHYRVRAFNAAGGSGWSESASATTLPAGPPAAPSNLSANAVSASEIDLTWDDNASDEDGFEIERSLAGQGNWSGIASPGADATSYPDTGLDPDTGYDYRVRAVNVLGGSAWSNVAGAVTPAVQAGDVYAGADVPVAGTVSGSYLDTYAAGGDVEAIEELQTGGKPSKRRSYLEHKWVFNVPAGGATVTFNLDAWHTPNGEGDDFEFSWSTDDVIYHPITTVDTYVLPVPLSPGLSGTVYVRVKDTDDTEGNSAQDTLYVDHMFIRVE